ncbi:MAG TPA: cohesin domain-containing protein [Burkholderiales bacterium]|nr:cohesin domain-containing protein [Burkholderiales bacterium]
MNKKRIRLGITLTGLAVVAGAGALLYSQDQPLPATKASAASPSARAAPEERYSALPSREAIGKPRGEPFGARSWAPPPPKRSNVVEAPAKPVAPPLPYRIAGQVTHEGVMQVVLARDDRVFTVRQGETLDNVYRIESITPDAVTFVYLPLDERQQLAVGGLRLEMATPRAVARVNGTPPAQAAAGDTRPAQLRWEGPKQVKAGSDFDVTLKLTAAQPVRALPLQLDYDAKLLEPVAVRPGELFAEGRFTYRVNPNGSIFVGASAGNAAPTDADFVVVTFRPLRLGNAELRLSAVALQGAAGRAIAHESPATFRTAIVQ